MLLLSLGEVQTVMPQLERQRSARSVLAVVTLSHLAQHFRVGVSVLYPDMMLGLGLNYTQLGIMTGANSIVSGFFQMFWSLLSRSVPRRVLLGLGNLLISSGTFVMGTANRFVELVGGNVVAGVGNAAQHPVGVSIVSDKFPREKTSGALSIHYGLGFVGNILSPVVLSYIAASLGWRQAMYFLAVVPFMASLLVFFGLTHEASASRSVREGTRGSLVNDLRSAIRIKGVMLIILGEAFAAGGAGMGVVVTYTPVFLRRYLNVGNLETSVIFSIAVFGGVIGTLFFGRLGDKLGNLRVAIPLIATGSSLIFLLTIYSSFSILLVLHLFFVAGAAFAFSSLLQAHIASMSTPRQRDILLGLFFTISQGVNSIWATVTGFVIDTYNSFSAAWILMGILGYIASFLMVLAYRQK